MSGVDLNAVYERYRPEPGVRLRDLRAAKVAAERFVRQDGRRFEMLKLALDAIGSPHFVQREVIARWKNLGGPRLHDFAPYTAHVMTVDMFFNLAIGSALIGRERPSNKVDVAYLYYLPFCMLFVSNDRLHERCVPCFLNEHQAFLSGRELKADLARLDAHYSALPAEVRDRGVMTFAHNPPPLDDFLTTRLWDRFLPKWRDNLTREPLSPEATAKLVEHIKSLDQAERLQGVAAERIDIQTARFISLETRVPARRGKWQILPPAVCK